MSFVYPQFFWVMTVPFVIFVFLVVTNREKVERLFDSSALQRLRADSEALPNSIRNLLLFSAVFAMIVALSRPVIEQGETTIRLKGLSVVSALDISGSMRCKDLYPNRLEFAKKKMQQFFDAMPADEIAVAAFAHSAFILAPFTSDKATLKQIVEGVNESYINMASTDFEAIATLASDMLAKKKQKILVLFSDGGDAKALEGMRERLQKKGIKLFAVLSATKKGAPIPGEDGHFMREKDGTIAISQLNEELGKIARESGGEYIVAANGREDMQRLARMLHEKFGDEKHGTIKIKDRKELFVYPLLLAVVLLLAGLSSLPAGRVSKAKGGER